MTWTAHLQNAPVVAPRLGIACVGLMSPVGQRLPSKSRKILVSVSPHLQMQVALSNDRLQRWPNVWRQYLGGRAYREGRGFCDMVGSLSKAYS
jgi:hypothetical protein